MNHEQTERRTRAFTLIELLVVIAVIALIIGILLPALRGARSTARRSVCSANLQQFGRAQGSYSNDFKEMLGALNGVRTASGTDSEHTGLVLQVQQIVDSGDGRRPTAQLLLNTFSGSVPDGPCVADEYEHLALIGYASSDFLMPISVCPEDRARLEWRAHPFDSNSWSNQPRKPGNQQNIEWLPYSSSYQLTPAAAAFSFHIWTGGAIAQYKQGSSHDSFDWYKVRFGRRRQNDIDFPSMKVAMMDSQQRHYGADLFYAYAEARQPLLFWDGSVSIRKTGDSNRGWSLTLPRTSAYTKVNYDPDLGFESPAMSNDFLPGYYKWTRGGLHGVDFGGGECSCNPTVESRAFYGE